MRIVITIGRTYAPPGIEIRASDVGLFAEVVGDERTWTAGIRHELENILKPPWRLHAPLLASTEWLFGAVPVVFSAAFLALDLILREGSPWSKTGRVLVSLGAGMLLALAVASVGWASAQTFELLPKNAMPRYQRWRKRVLAAVGTVIIGIVASGLYGLAS